MATIKQLTALYESEEHKATIDYNHWSKPCTAGLGDNETGFEGCNSIKPLYEFPIVSSSKEQYKPDQDGVKRKNICKACLRKYNNMIQKKRRSQVFSKEEALSILEMYIKTNLGFDSSDSQIFLVLKLDPTDSYPFLRLEQIKKDVKKELKPEDEQQAQ